jgi:hypothetical protein
LPKDGGKKIAVKALFLYIQNSWVPKIKPIGAASDMKNLMSKYWLSVASHLVGGSHFLNAASGSRGFS